MKRDQPAEWNGFLISRCNRRALKTCLKPGGGLILLRGPSGSGKTHLLHTLAKHPISARPCQYMTCAALVAELLDRIEKGQKEDWIKELGQKDLLIDDGLVLTGNLALQREVSLLAEQIIDRGGRIVLVTDALHGPASYRRAVLLKPDRGLRRRYLEALCEKEELALSAKEKRRCLHRCHRDLRRLGGLLATNAARKRFDSGKGGSI